MKHVRLPKAVKAKVTKEVIVENEGKKKRGVRVARFVEEEEDFGRTESQ